MFLLRKQKKEYFAKINENDIIDNRKFWQTVKPVLSDKVRSKEPFILVNNDDIIEVAITFNEFFSNILENLEILEYQCEDNQRSSLSSNPILQSIIKCRYHPGINIIRCYSQRLLSFYVSVVDKSTVLKEIRKLSVKKAIQDTDIPKNEKFFADQIYLQRN